MNIFLNSICVGALLTIIYIEVDARSLRSSPIKIVNGTDAEDGEFPYMVQYFEEFDEPKCGASIIGDKWILTAGHCVKNGKGGSIVYGTNILFDHYANNTVKVKQINLHPKFGHNENEVPIYDVAILELVDAIQFSNKAQPVKLPDVEEVPFHVYGFLTGWGLNVTYARDPQIHLQKIRLQLLDDLECSAKLNDYRGPGYFNGTHHLCSDDYWNGECIGDSGSPFVINGTQYGIVSWSFKPCGITPGAYSRVANPEYRAFIKNITGI